MTVNNDCISRQAAMNAFAERVKRSNNSDFAPVPRWNDAVEIVENLPSVQPTLYGYQIEHLAYIAKVMEKEGVTAEYATKTFEDISRAVRMIIEEAQQKVEEMLNECRPPRPYKEEE